MMELNPKLTPDKLKNLKKGQAKMTEMLRVFDSICRKYNLKYWCQGGTFIGAVRHGGWISYDGDIDISMFGSDYDIFKTKINELPDSMFLQNRESDSLYYSDLIKLRDKNSAYTNYPHYMWHCGLQIDIYLYYKHNYKIYKYFNMAFDKEYNHVLDYNIVFPLREISFEGIYVYVPNQIETYSKLIWGEYPIPLLPIEKRYPREGDIDPDNARKHDVENYPHLYKLS